nr:MAG TPA: hypothetical protein [Caudoviricetes sp.]
MSNVLKEAMLTLYRDSPEILYCLQQLDYDELSINFQREMDQRISREDVKEVEEFLASEKYVCYCNAVNEASMALTREISKLLEFVLTPREGELN